MNKVWGGYSPNKFLASKCYSSAEIKKHFNQFSIEKKLTLDDFIQIKNYDYLIGEYIEAIRQDEDAAELISIYHLTQKLNQPFAVYIKDKNKVIVRFGVLVKQ